MTSKKLGALLRSVPPAIARTDAPEQPNLTVLPEPAVEAPTSRRAARPANSVEPEVPLQVLVPAGIRRQLAVKAAEEGKSLRALVLRAIRSLGIEVTEAEIKGKRGRKAA